MKKAVDYILSLLFKKEESRHFPEKFIQSSLDWIDVYVLEDDSGDSLFAETTDEKFAQKIIEQKLKKLLGDDQFLENLNSFINRFEEYLGAKSGNKETYEKNKTQFQTSDLTVSKKNVVEGGNLTGKNIHLGDIVTYNEVTKNLELRCPSCGAEAPEETAEIGPDFSTKDKVTVSPSTELTCNKCGRRYFSFPSVFKNTSDYLGLKPKESHNFNHLLRAIHNDLKLGHTKEAYERCEKLKENYGSTAAIYGYCALTYFFSTDMDEIINSSAKKILVYLDDSKMHDPNWEEHDVIAKTIAWGYSNVIRQYLDYERYKIPQKRKLSTPKPTVEEKRMIEDEYRLRKMEYRSKMLRILGEYETCFRIFPSENFLNQGILELCGHNGTPWFDLTFKSIFFKPQIHDIEGFVWDYYDLVSNTKDFNNNVDNRPEEFLSRMLNQILQINVTYIQPEILIGTQTSDITTTVKKRLVRNGLIFWGIILLLIVIGFLSDSIYGVLFSLGIIIALAFQYKKVMKSMSDIFEK